MKKTILKITALAASLMITHSAHSQEGFQMGAQWIGQMTWLLNQDDQTNDQFEYVNTYRSAFGVTGQYGFSDNFGIGLDVLYSFQGQRFKLSGEERFKELEYLKIPLTFVYNYNANSSLMFIYKLGPQVGILAQASLSDEDGMDIVGDQESAYMNMEFGVVASVGLGVKLMDRLYLDAAVRYDYGLTNAEDDSYANNVNNPVLANGTGATFSSNRARTNNMTAGISIGLRCLFND